MTPRSLFNIILKVVGIVFLRNLFLLLPQDVSSYLYIGFGNNGEGTWIFVFSLIQLALYAWILFVLLFRTNRVIDKLGLDKGFPEERFDISIHRSTVLYLAFVLSGVLILINALPAFCRQVISYFQQKGLNYEPHPNLTYLVFYFVEIIIGLILIGNAKSLTNLVELRKRK